MSSSGDPEGIDPLLGRVVLGRYRIVRELARGGMGAIYLARSEGAASFTKPVVIKRMLPEFVGDDAAARMFKREARIMALLRHPGIVSVFDFGREESSYLLVMDYVHGFHLGRWASWMLHQRGEVPVVLAVQVVVQVLEALQYAHSATGEGGEPLRIVHRDVSPSNVLLDVDGHVRLADFGIAQSGADAPDVKTATRTVKGKFSYMAPEILEGGDPTPSGDVYSAAVVLHEILIGRNEFRTSSPTSTIGRVLTHTPTRLDAVRADCSAELADVIEMALQKRPEHRFETAGDLSRALRQVRGVAGEEADALLAQTIARDFRDPSLPAMFDLPDLELLERALRLPVSRISSKPPGPNEPRLEVTRPERRSDGPTTDGKVARDDARDDAVPSLASTSDTAAPPAPSRTPRIAALVAGLVVLVGVSGAIAWSVGSGTPVEPDIVYVEASPAGIDQRGTVDRAAPPPVVPPTPPTIPTTPTAETPPATPPDEPPATTPEATRVVRTPTKRTEPASADEEAAAIQRAFARHTEAMHRCFAGSAAEGPRDLVLHFSIAASGAVQRVDLSPADASAMPPGQCVLRIARGIDFPATAAPRSFRIPIEVRAR
ncbi:MAG: serine/threonine protein kinase [Myxococcota bacterium]|nr:serine/threonine protein kinase [Myxococcota bacterium]